MKTLLALSLIALSACGDGDGVPRAETLDKTAVEDVAPVAPADDDAETSGGGPESGDHDPEIATPAEDDAAAADHEMDAGSLESDATKPPTIPDAAEPEPSPAVAAIITPMDSGGPADGGSEPSEAGSAPADAGSNAQDAGIDATALIADARVVVDASDGGDSALDGTGGDASVQGRLLARLTACAALGPGEYHPPPIVDDLGRCWAECVIAASCSDVRRFMCREQAPALAGCQFRCPVEPVAQPFGCGDGQLVWVGFVCDSLRDCANGADEQNCDTFSCANGVRVTAPTRCNGFRDCSDGSDELGCASTCPSPSG